MFQSFLDLMFMLLVVIICCIAGIRIAGLRFKRNCIAFFHPYCNDGGGGERVLWCAIQGLLERSQSLNIAIYTGDSESGSVILSKANERFGISLDSNRIFFVRLASRPLLEAKYYPVFTLLGQSLGSVVVAFDALIRFVPEVFVDTMGCSFTYPVARYVFGCYVAAYVHYPTISTDMLSLVQRREATYNNRGFISRSAFWTGIKLAYYRLFAFAYGWCGRCSHVTMCNSSWTQAHIAHLWRGCPAVVYPPCNTERLQRLPGGPREPLAVSIAQFRPEKNHALQLQAFALLRAEEGPGCAARLAIIGSCRNADDEARVEALRRDIVRLGLQAHPRPRHPGPARDLSNAASLRARGLHRPRCRLCGGQRRCAGPGPAVEPRAARVHAHRDDSESRRRAIGEAPRSLLLLHRRGPSKCNGSAPARV